VPSFFIVTDGPYLPQTREKACTINFLVGLVIIELIITVYKLFKTAKLEFRPSATAPAAFWRRADMARLQCFVAVNSAQCKHFNTVAFSF